MQRSPSPRIDRATRIHWTVLAIVQLIMLVELGVAVAEGHWGTALLVAAIMGVTLVPARLGRRFRVHVPAELQLLTVLFIFAALFLGEIHSYYERIWWWDIALHAGSGLLLGILGFLLVYVLNESERVGMHLHPRFVALFAFLFAVAVGTLWEIFEFAMDQLAGTRMQKPMLGDPSGLTDTMWDLIVDTLGALAISVFGWWYMSHGRKSFLEAWIQAFIERNPRLFRRGRNRAG
ncbi:hypothetical protein [Arhodomonas sp. SL1]|uniref:hypothetical protein n=1 Tax=Arhodomonas sp. SL1 TaxID=3425691 RepID=UPI003F882B68